MIGGTSANLQAGEVYSMTELLYALMLPSGNDAAIAISEVIGLLLNIKLKNKPVNPHK
jgi:D-alanyl-D-alanine carboxypeptidase (penicillin-binding protein 5/6)